MVGDSILEELLLVWDLWVMMLNFVTVKAFSLSTSMREKLITVKLNLNEYRYYDYFCNSYFMILAFSNSWTRHYPTQDPLEHYGTPLPQRAAMALLPLQSVSLQDLFISPSPTYGVSSAPASPAMSHSSGSVALGSSSRYGQSAKSPDLRLRVPKSPSLRVPTRSAPVPPPRKNKKAEPENG